MEIIGKAFLLSAKVTQDEIKFDDQATIKDALHTMGIPSVNGSVQGTNAIDLVGKLGLADHPKAAPLFLFRNTPTVQVFKTNHNAVTPFKTLESDAGLDLTLIEIKKQITSNCFLYDTGLKIKLPRGYYAEIVPRSSIIKSGYILANNIGIIDASYFGNIYVALAKIDPQAPDLQLPFRGVQLIVKEQNYPRVVLSDDTTGTETVRSSGGFGSTGI